MPSETGSVIARDQQSATRMRGGCEGWNFFENAEEIRRLNDHSSGVSKFFGSQRTAIDLPGLRVWQLFDFKPQIARVRGQHLPILRMHAARDEHAVPAREPLCHQRSFGERRRAVVHRGIRHFLAGKLRHQRLKLENRSQRALSKFRLIRSVRSEELAALHERVSNHRAQMRVNACSQK